MSLLQAFLPQQSQPASPSADVGEEQDNWASDAQDALGNADLTQILAGGMANEIGPWCSPEPTTDPVEQKINYYMEHPAPGVGDYDGAWSAAYGDRGKLDPKNEDEDLASAEHYLWARKFADDNARGNGKLGDVAGMATGLLTAGLTVGYQGYKGAAYAMKDHSTALGLGMMATGVGLIPGAMMLLGGEQAGDGMLKAVSSNDSLPSRPSMKELGWGLKGSGDAIADHWNKLWS